MIVYLIRHTHPLVEEGICYGQSDLAVDNSFQQQALIIKDSLDNCGHFISSPLIRCRKLANFLCGEGCVVEEDKRLMELDFGEWEMVPWAAIAPEAMEKWGSDFVRNRPSGGESYEDMYQRVAACWDSILERYEHMDSPLAVVSHSGTMRCILSKILEIPLKKSFCIKMGYASLIKLNISGDFCQIEFLKT